MSLCSSCCLCRRCLTFTAVFRNIKFTHSSIIDQITAIHQVHTLSDTSINQKSRTAQIFHFHSDILYRFPLYLCFFNFAILAFTFHFISSYFVCVKHQDTNVNSLYLTREETLDKHLSDTKTSPRSKKHQLADKLAD